MSGSEWNLGSELFYTFNPGLRPVRPSPGATNMSPLAGLSIPNPKSQIRKSKFPNPRSKIAVDRLALPHGRASAGSSRVDVKLHGLQKADQKPEQRTEKLDRSQMFLRDGHHERFELFLRVIHYLFADDTADGEFAD